MCSSYCVFLELTNVESSDQDGKETQVSFKTFEGGRGRTRVVVSVQGDHTWPASRAVFWWNNLIPSWKKCAPLPKPSIHRVTPNSQNPNSQAAWKIHRLELWGKNLREKRKIKVKGAFLLLWISQLVPHVWFIINTVWSPQQTWLSDRTQLLPPNKANWKYKTIPQHHLSWQTAQHLQLSI